MKTAYELAMERLGRASPLAKLSEEQRKALAELDSVYKAKIAEREIAQLLDVGLSDLTRPGAHDKMIDRFPTWQKAEQVSFYRIGEHRLWGLSYRILHPIIPRLVAGDWNV